VANYAGVTESTWYIGGLMEKVLRNGITEYRHLIPSGSGSAIYTRRDNGTASTYYVTSDHLGSGDLVMDSAANILAKESFTPFGARRGSNWQGNPSGADFTTFQATTRRGFTGHEMLDSVSLVHMNGRVYDPYVGRFLSPDPIIQTLALSQALNAYSYVMNNPLSLIDPSGHSWLSKAFKSIGKFFKKFWRPIVAIVVAVVSYGYFAPMASQWLAGSVALAPGITAGGAAVAGGISGALAGGITGGFKGALIGGMAGLLFAAGNAAWGGVKSSFVRGAARALTAGVVGGASSEALGGSFRDGFYFTFFASAAHSIYQSVVRYRATWASGGDAVEKTANQRPVEAANNFGTQGQPVDRAGFWGEGGKLSRFANRIPGMNAIAGMHDEIVTHISGAWRGVLNVPMMVPAVATTLPALVPVTPGAYQVYMQSRSD
jgi:RHS repeat-associated protein